MVKSVLDAEAARVLHAHDPRVDVREADLRRVLRRLALDDALRAEVNEVAQRRVVAAEPLRDCDGPRHERGHDERHAPRGLGAEADDVEEEDAQ